MKTIFSTSLLNKALVFLGASFFVSSSAVAAISIDQQPLLASKPVPANVAIVGSFEFPTMVTKAYKADNYYDSEQYIGYFDNKKCYLYKYADKEEDRYFEPVNTNGPHCSHDDHWSGNFLNWATMQTIDIFRHVLTGGHRSTDEVGNTILEKGVQTGQGSDTNFPDGNIRWLEGDKSRREKIKNATAVNWGQLRTRIGGKAGRAISRHEITGSKLYFTREANPEFILSQVAYNPAEHTIKNKIFEFDFPLATTFELSVRVQVCVEGMLEDNCVKQPNGDYKPVGLIQQYAEEQGTPRMRFSAFGYLNDPSDEQEYGVYRNRKGGVMHARMKYVGPNKADEKNIAHTNTNAEWDALTGIFNKNPDPDDASSTPFSNTPVTHSGVISYINRSGHIVDGTKFKKRDNVSELYYAAYRYMKGLDNIELYSKLDIRKSGVNLDQLVGGLPIIRDWKKDDHDPMQFACQKNFVLGIGDTITANDWWIEEDGGHDDPVFAKDRINKLRNNMYKREGIDPNKKYYIFANSGDRKGEGSDNIAVFAYDANTTDMRPDMPGKQTMQTYWIDVLEKGLKPKETNPYWMATKYGGFKVPETFDPVATLPDSNRNSLPESLWWTSGETLTTNKNTENKRPDNFFAANGPEGMINSLTQAFRNIQLEQRGGSSSLSLSRTEPNKDAMVFQANYVSGAWTGNLYGYKVDKQTQTISSEPEWDAESQLPMWTDRKVYINNGGLKDFKTHGASIQGLSQDQVDYLLGDDSKVKENNFRKRASILGDIVNSQPVYVGSPRIDAFSTRTFPGTDSYAEWARSKQRTPVVYVGGNDGMLHGFDAESGKELFAFIPAAVVQNGLAELSNRNYLHRYFVDGEITVADVYINNSWRTVLVGTLGAGGVGKNRSSTHNAIYALDITDPNAVNLLWEKSSDDIKNANGVPALGVSLGKPVIIQNTSNQWRVVLGNGPNSGDTAEGKISSASLISLDLFAGNAVVTQVPSELDNGLSAIRAWDSNGDGLTDTLYAGDLNGNLWKFDASTNAPNPKKLFSATDPSGAPQPITSLPLVGISPYDRSTWVFFGTGLYLSTKDAVNDQVQSWYGIKDNSTLGKTRTSLLERKIIKDVALTTEGHIKVARVIDSGTRAELEDKEGWHLDFYNMQGEQPLATGERMITPNRFQGGALTGVTRNPNAHDPCAIDGAGMTMALDPFTGARLPDNYFDVNEDGEITATGEEDMVEIGGRKFIVSGVGFDTGFSDTTVLGNKIYAQTDGGELIDINFKSYTSASSRSSWRELINREN